MNSLCNVQRYRDTNGKFAFVFLSSMQLEQESSHKRFGLIQIIPAIHNIVPGDNSFAPQGNTVYFMCVYVSLSLMICFICYISIFFLSLITLLLVIIVSIISPLEQFCVVISKSAIRCNNSKAILFQQE
jgi:hypothetical protein